VEKKEKMNQIAKANLTDASSSHGPRQNKNADSATDRWHQGLENHEKLKKILPFLNEDEGYL
jgi:hypothetical protein